MEKTAQACSDLCPQVEVSSPCQSWDKLAGSERLKVLETVLERDIRPPLRIDGGDIELHALHGDRVTISYRGRCRSCPLSLASTKDYIAKVLQEALGTKLQLDIV